MLSLLEKIKGINFKKVSKPTSIPAPSFQVAMDERDLLSEDILFRTDDSTSSKSFSLVLQEEISSSSARAEISIQAFVKNKFRNPNPETDFIFYSNDCYMNSIKLDIDPINCTKTHFASHLKMDLDKIPFDVEEIILTASIYGYEKNEYDYTLKDLPQTNLFIRDNETNNISNNVDLTAEFSNCSGIIIGSLVRGYVVRENSDWVFLSYKKGVKNTFSDSIHYFFPRIEVLQ